jgi:hypothetical protein
MKIVEGKKIYQHEEDAARDNIISEISSYDGQNHQWYSLGWAGDICVVVSNNSGDCYGDYKDIVFPVKMTKTFLPLSEDGYHDGRYSGKPSYAEFIAEMEEEDAIAFCEAAGI